jgi:hypothetical protein
MYKRLFEEILTDSEIDIFLKEMPSPLKINFNKEGENNIPFRFIGMLGQANSILHQIHFKEGINLLGPFNNSLKNFVEANTINLGDILPTIIAYNNKIQNHLNEIERYINHFGIPHYDLFNSTIFNEYSRFKKEVIIGLKQLQNSGLTDELCNQATNILVESINNILEHIRRYYFWSLCSNKTRDDIRDEKILTYIVNTYKLTVTNFILNNISFN